MNVLGHHLNNKEIGMLIGAMYITYVIIKYVFKILWYAVLGYFGVKIYRDITRP